MHGGRVGPSRGPARRAAVAALALGVLVAGCSTSTGSTTASGTTGSAPGTSATGTTAGGRSPSCAQGAKDAWQAQMDAYAKAGSYPTIQSEAAGHATEVSVEIPAITFTGDGLSSTLPVGPCQYIYRYTYPAVTAADGSPVAGHSPFRYVEVDWNTEGLPRGPEGSFSSAHFDFHYYTRPKEQVDATMMCPSANGKTCDPLQTPYDQMRRFLNLPEPRLVPTDYRADIDSSIPEMGLHLLDMDVPYTVEAVNHRPTLIYGTYDGAVVFAEASVTLQTLQDAVRAPDHKVRFEYRQPAAFATTTDWPTSFTIEHRPATGAFVVRFEGMQHHDATPSS